MPDISLIAPIAIPVLGAAALLILGDGNRYRSRDPLPSLVAGTVFAAAVSLPERVPLETELLPWSAVRAFGNRPQILIDAFALVFIFALALLAIAATIVGDRLSGRYWAMPILFWGGCLGIVVSANPLMLLMSWVLCELALVGASLMTRHSRLLVYRLAVGGAGAVALVLLAMRAQGHPAADLRTVLPGVSPQLLAALFAVGAIRMGLYPLHLAGFTDTDVPLAPLVLGRLSGAVAGLYLWLRAFSIIRSLPSYAEYLVVLGGIAVLISSLSVWGARRKQSLFPWLVGFELGIIVVALGLGVPQFSMFAALEMLNLLLAGSLFGLSLQAAAGIEGRWARLWVRGLGLLAMASLLGLPPTPGFVARWGLYRRAIEMGNVAAILPVVVASGLLIPALLAAIRVRTGRPVPQLSNHTVVGLTILGLPLVMTSVQPLLLTPALDTLTSIKSYTIMAPLIRAASTRLSAQIMALILIPALVGYSLDRVHQRWRVRGQLDSLWDFLSLEWLYDLLASTVLRAAIAVSILLAFLELGSTLGWVVVVSLLVVLMVLRR